MTVTVTGLRELVIAADEAGKATRRAVRQTLRETATEVRDDAQRRFEEKFPGRPAKFGISVRRAGTVSVEERLRRTTGRRPDYGKQQMRFALLPAAEAGEAELAMRLERAVTSIAERLVK